MRDTAGRAYREIKLYKVHLLRAAARYLGGRGGEGPMAVPDCMRAVHEKAKCPEFSGARVEISGARLEFQEAQVLFHGNLIHAGGPGRDLDENHCYTYFFAQCQGCLYGRGCFHSFTVRG